MRLPAGSQKWFREDNWRLLFFPEGKAMPPEYRVINQAPSLQVAQTPPNAWGLHDTAWQRGRVVSRLAWAV